MSNAGRPIVRFKVRLAGFTLAEAMIATFILAVATTGIAGLLASSSQQSDAMQSSSVSQELARQMMEEIAAKSVADADGNISLGPEAGENTRSSFDQIDDYDGYTDTTSSIAMLDGTSVDLGEAQTYTRTVEVEYRAAPAGAATSSTDAAFCVVTIDIRRTGAAPATLVRLFARTRNS